MIPRSLKSYVIASGILMGAFGGPIAAYADVVSPYLRLHLSAHPNRAKMLATDEPTDGYIPLIVKLTDPAATMPEGIVELHRRGDLMLMYAPEEKLGELAESGYFSRIEGRAAARPALDMARNFTEFNHVLAADGLPRELTGRGVVAGFTDVGFDPGHIDFRDEATGTTRVKLRTHYGASPEDCARQATPSEIIDWVNPNPDYYHATHVAGIFAGGYKGNGYFGIAPEADIVASTSSDLYDALLLAGMEDVVEYAKEVGAPAVINMSISCPTGPHDGTSLVSQYLSDLANDATVCVSAGNDGMRNGYFHATFADGRPAALRLVDYPQMASWYASGIVDVWSQDATPLNFSLLVIDRTTGGVAYRLPMPEITAENPEIYCEFPDELKDYMEGAVAMASELNPLNGRFNATFIFDLYNYEVDGSRSIRYCIGLEINGQEGKNVEAYSSDALYMKTCTGYGGAVSNNGAINDFITGEGVIGVGALTSRSQWPMMNGDTATSGYTEGMVANFSSFRSATEQGPSLPDIVAPGAHLVSAVSGAYVLAHPDFEDYAAVEEIEGTSYYWRADCGTSMASPYVAGVCALMLEANPNLSPAEVKDIIVATASRPAKDPQSPRWGGGVLNSHQAILTAQARAAVIDIPADGTPVATDHGIYDLYGRRLEKITAPGIYIINGKKTAIR